MLKAGEIIGRDDAAAERFPVNVGGENVRVVRCKNLRAVQGAYETPIANGCDVLEIGRAFQKDGRRELADQPACAGTSAWRSVPRVRQNWRRWRPLVCSGAARMLDVLEGCCERGSNAGRIRRTTRRRAQAEPSLTECPTAALQADEDFAMGSRAKEWPLGEGDDGSWHKASGMPAATCSATGGRCTWAASRASWRRSGRSAPVSFDTRASHTASRPKKTKRPGSLAHG